MNSKYKIQKSSMGRYAVKKHNRVMGVYSSHSDAFAKLIELTEKE